MKNQNTISIFLLLFLGVQVMMAQQVTREAAPSNPVPLAYLTTHFGYLGPVKTAVNMSFDEAGRVTLIKGDPDQTFTYLKDKIIVNKFGNTFHYTLNAKNQITGWTIPGTKEMGTYIYDKTGNLIDEKDVYEDNVAHYTYAYDANNRVISKTAWYDGSASRIDIYSYDGDAQNLMVTKEIEGDSSSRGFYYYKNGVLVDYVYDYNGASNMENVNLDARGNVTSYVNPTYGEDYTVEITYY
jgi:hypothetical protein